MRQEDKISIGVKIADKNKCPLIDSDFFQAQPTNSDLRMPPAGKASDAHTSSDYISAMCIICCRSRRELCQRPDTNKACSNCDCCQSKQSEGEAEGEETTSEAEEGEKPEEGEEEMRPGVEQQVPLDFLSQGVDPAARLLHRLHYGKQSQLLQPRFCPCPTAKDYNELCLYWAYTGLCNRAPYMNTMCAYSCRACC
ncbi:Glutamyl-tRNA(Gln) amidotransferase subunit A [Trichinella spiralis]|uniref:Glutamyl-tRNA(Gln) amidotransferase subunit A n=1 Tax=Trichinella spiralis TaxID=6334 RepID=A0ABR3K3T3_TRISP|nr:putative ShTK domain protein [Trichinella spiralis]